MPQLKTYKLFISHSWAYSDAYEKLVKMLDRQSNFAWIDYSVPRNDPIHDAINDKALYAAIKNQMQFVNCVVMLAGVYSTHSKWINHEIYIAKSIFSKPLIAVEPWGSERTSLAVKNSADAIVKWQGASIVSAIREKS